MSAEALAHAFKNPTDSPSATLVWLALADTANDQNENRLWMSNAGLQRKTGLSENTVRRCLQWLVQDECLEVVDTPTGKPVEYRFLFGTPSRFAGDPPQGGTPPPPQGGTLTQVSTTQETQPCKSDNLRAELFDALCEESGIDPKALTKSGRGELNRAVKDLGEVGASPEEVSLKARAYRRRWPNVDITPSALSKHWASLGSVVPLRPGVEAEERVEYDFVGKRVLSEEEIARGRDRIRELSEGFRAKRG